MVGVSCKFGSKISIKRSIIGDHCVIGDKVALGSYCPDHGNTSVAHVVFATDPVHSFPLLFRQRVPCVPCVSTVCVPCVCVCVCAHVLLCMVDLFRS
jgi:hypothetical protein